MSKPLRVLHVLSSLNRGGAETMIMNIFRSINKENIQFDFVVNDVPSVNGYEDEVELLGGKIYRIPKYNFLNHKLYVQSWKKLLSNHPEYNIVHVHYTTFAFILYPLLRNYNRKIITHSHSSNESNKLKYYFKKLNFNVINKYSIFKYACSKNAGVYLFGKYSEFQLINNSIEPNLYTFNLEIRKEIRGNFDLTNEVVVGHVGRFNEVKNHKFIIEVFNEFQTLCPKSKLLLIGDGKLRNDIVEQIDQLSLKDKVIMTGVVDNVNDLLQAIDLFIFPSFYEGFPVTLVEAQASGLKCFASDSLTKEIEITDLVTFIKLDLPAKHWATILNSSYNYCREDTSEEITKAGFDVKDNSLLLERSYTVLNESEIYT